MEENSLKDLVLKIKDLNNNDKCYSLLINKEIWNKELFMLYTKNKPGLNNYYPDKKEETLIDNASIKEVIDKLIEYELTYNDVLFIDQIKFEDYVLLNTYIKEFSTLRSIVKNSKSESEMSKKIKGKTQEILDIIENNEENSTISIDKFTRMLLLIAKSEKEILEKAKEKNIEIIFE